MSTCPWLTTTLRWRRRSRTCPAPSFEWGFKSTQKPLAAVQRQPGFVGMAATNHAGHEGFSGPGAPCCCAHCRVERERAERLRELQRIQQHQPHAHLHEMVEPLQLLQEDVGGG